MLEFLWHSVSSHSWQWLYSTDFSGEVMVSLLISAFYCLSVLGLKWSEWIEMNLHAAHSYMRLTSADFFLYFNSVSRNIRQGYESLGSGLSPLIFISVLLHSVGYGDGLDDWSNTPTEKSTFTIRGQWMSPSLWRGRWSIRRWRYTDVFQHHSSNQRAINSYTHLCSSHAYI